MNYNTIQALAHAYPQLEGSKILMLLSEHPNRPVLSTVLELALSQKITIPEAEQGHFHPLGVPLTDYQTLKEIDKRLLRLNQLKAQYLSERSRGFSEKNADLSDTRAGFSERNAESSPFDEEIKALIRYRKDCTKPWGEIKNSDDELRQAYRRHYAAIHRLFAKAEKDGFQAAVAIVKRSLRLGYSSMVKDE
jgi:hypothetical protein